MAAPQAAPKGLVSLRDIFGDEIVALGARNDRLMMLDADLATSTRTAKFQAAYPGRHVNVGIAEQNMVGIAAGLALGGFVPFVNTFASFLTRRACDQIAISVAYPRLNVKFFGFHGGINLGEDGATQQAVEDLAIMNAIPGIRVYVPIDGNDLKRAMNEVVDLDGPSYIRLSRFPAPLLTPALASPSEPLSDYRVLRDGGDILVLVIGTEAAKVVEAADRLATCGTQAKVVGITRVKPLADSIAALVRGAPGMPLAVVEEHSIHGGLADMLSSLLDRHGISHRLNRIGIADRFGESGPPEALLEAFGLAGEPLVQALEQTVDGRG